MYNYNYNLFFINSPGSNPWLMFLFPPLGSQFGVRQSPVSILCQTACRSGVNFCNSFSTHSTGIWRLLLWLSDFSPDTVSLPNNFDLIK